MEKTIKIIILFIFLFVISIFYIGLTRDTNYNTSSLINKDIPEFQIISFDESNFYTRDDIKKNNYTLINFWASWCVPCRIEHPLLMKLSQKKNLIILGINFKDKEPQAKTFLSELGDPYDLLAKDKNGKQSVRFGIYGIPESILINKDLMIIQKFVGPLSVDDYNNIIKIIEKL
jgi:cytochrome c biogenesis protein CcmG/thiol:disulfide interchange protein DsbE